MYKLLEAKLSRIVNIITNGDLDANCRLRNKLNVHCLAEIFQYLDSVDLYTLGEMNDFYRQIVHEIVIPTHEINFFDLCKRGVTISEVFERYGTKIQRICFGDVDERQTTEQLVQLIAKYCASDQLKSVRIISRFAKPIILPNQFRKIEKLQCYGNGQLSVTLSESLNYIHLRGISLDPDFDWTQLKNLKELYLENIHGINADSFIEFLRQEPKIKVFHHEKSTFDGSIPEISDALATHCGKYIQDYSGVMPANQRNMYNFLSEFKAMRIVCLTTDQICGGDIVAAIKRLSDNNTIEELHIKYSKKDNHRDNCLFLRNPEMLGITVKPFNRLKTVTLSGASVSVSDTLCIPFRLINILSTQVLSNVENLNIKYAPMDWIFITFARRLRFLDMDIFKLRRGIDEAVDIISYLETILHHRNNGQSSNDFIEIKFKFQNIYDIFVKIRNRGNNIRLTMADSLDYNARNLFQNSLTHNANLYKGVHSNAN